MKQKKVQSINRAIWRLFRKELPKKVDSRERKYLKRVLETKVTEVIGAIPNFKSLLGQDSAEIMATSPTGERTIKPSATLIESLQHAKTQPSGD